MTDDREPAAAERSWAEELRDDLVRRADANNALLLPKPGFDDDQTEESDDDD